jgi:Tfp pilus assembly protein PilF
VKKIYDGWLKISIQMLLIVFCAVLAYSNTFDSPFILDDKATIVNSDLVRGQEVFHGTEAVKGRRYLGFLTFALNYYVHELDVTGYHVVNLAIHIINACLVYLLVLLTLRTPRLRNSAGNTTQSVSLLPLGAALLFVSHPIQSQAVTYIVQRFASLATLFYLLCLVLYIRSRLSENSAVRYMLYALSLLSAVCAMKTKEISITLPVIIVLYELLFFQGATGKRILRLVPFLLTMLIIPLSLIGIDKPIGEVIGDVSEVTRVQTSISRWEYLMTQFRVLVTYIRLVFVPVGQNLDYDYPVYRTFFDTNVVFSFLFLASLFGAALTLLYRSSRSNVTDHPSSVTAYRLISFGIFWFFITLSVESSLIPIADVIFEHRMYLPAVGVYVGTSTVIMIILEKYRDKRWMRRSIMASFIVVIIVLTGTTYARNRVWKSEMTLWEDVVAKSPQKARGYNNVAEAYIHNRKYNEAHRSLSKALEIRPLYPEALNNMAMVYKSRGQNEKALEYYNRSLRLDPRSFEIHINIGFLFLSRGDIDKAINHLESAVRLNPYNAKAHLNLGIAYKKKGLILKAREQYRLARNLSPELFEIRSSSGKSPKE